MDIDSWTTVVVQGNQDNGWDCGIFSKRYMELCATGAAVDGLQRVTQAQIPALRVYYALLVSGKLTLQQVKLCASENPAGWEAVKKGEFTRVQRASAVSACVGEKVGAGKPALLDIVSPSDGKASAPRSAISRRVTRTLLMSNAEAAVDAYSSGTETDNFEDVPEVGLTRYWYPHVLSLCLIRLARTLFRLIKLLSAW
jgi:hypothetical protein